jgi:hypothetical protein
MNILAQQRLPGSRYVLRPVGLFLLVGTLLLSGCDSAAASMPCPSLSACATWARLQDGGSGLRFLPPSGFHFLSGEEVPSDKHLHWTVRAYIYADTNPSITVELIAGPLQVPQFSCPLTAAERPMRTKDDRAVCYRAAPGTVGITVDFPQGEYFYRVDTVKTGPSAEAVLFRVVDSLGAVKSRP